MAEILSTLSSTGDRGTPTNGGGYYTSIETWQAGQQQNLVAGGNTAVLECYEGTTVNGGWQADGSLNDSLNLSGWTTGASNFITIKAAAGEEHDGGLDSGFRVVGDPGTFTTLFNIAQSYTVLEDLSAYVTGTASQNYGPYRFSATFISMKRCLGKTNSTGTGYTRSAFGFNAEDCHAENCLAYDSPSGFYESNFNAPTVYNCTAIDCGIGFFAASSGAGMDARNCVAFGNTSDFTPTVDFNASSTNNAAGDTSAPGANAVDNVTGADFVDYAANDFTPAEGGKLDGTGADLSGTFTDDITGYERTLPWDIGAYAIQSGASTFADTNSFTITIDPAPASTVDPVDLSQNQTLAQAILTQANSLVAASLAQSQQIDETALTVTGALSAATITQSQAIDQALLATAVSLIADDMSQAQALEVAALISAGTISPRIVSQSQTLEQAVLAISGIVVDDLSQGQFLEQAQLLESGVLSVNSLFQAQDITQPDITQNYVLPIVDISQAQSLGTADLQVDTITLQPASIEQAIILQEPGLTQYAVITASSLTQGQVINTATTGDLAVGTLDGRFVLYASLDAEFIIH